MSFVKEATLSAFFEALFAKLASSESLPFATEKQGYKELKKWEKVLRNIQAVLDDAEDKQMRDRQVKLWLAELQDLAYDVDDVLDEFATEALGNKLKQEHQPSRSKVRKIIHTFTSNFNPNAFMFSYKMMSKMKLITVRLQDLATQKSDLQLRENDVDDDCLSILTQHSLGAKDFIGHPYLKEVGEQIVQKCNGLPLAARTVGGLLRTKVDPDAWKDVLENEIWNSSQEKFKVESCEFLLSNKMVFSLSSSTTSNNVTSSCDNSAAAYDE
ncbi:NB-ARC domain-containing protein [Corchorus olitorius]|uniref:NB-ARC domain-containing protein n=1 Tax=Corchorus olitorius TaxID=93759 RepID=A0A1R3IXX8_9ROSI|nr:NB-ARC domain-containing protein [Corchorus olitorius]